MASQASDPEVSPWQVDGASLVPVSRIDNKTEDSAARKDRQQIRFRGKKKKNTSPRPIVNGVMAVTHPPHGQNLIAFPRGGRILKQKSHLSQSTRLPKSKFISDDIPGLLSRGQPSVLGDGGSDLDSSVYESHYFQKQDSLISPSQETLSQADYMFSPTRPGGDSISTQFHATKRSSYDRDQTNAAPATTKNDELFYSWLGHQWETSAPVEKWKSLRLDTPMVTETDNPFQSASPKLNHRIKMTTLRNSLNKAKAIKFGNTVSAKTAIDVTKERADISSACFAHIASKVAVRSKEEAELLTIAWQVQMSSFDQLYTVMAKLDKQVKGVDHRVATIQSRFEKTLKDVRDRASEREERCFHHIKNLEEHLVATGRDILELRLNSGNNKPVRNTAGGDDDGEDSDEDALSSRVYQKLAGEYEMLDGVRASLEQELKNVEKERDSVISMLSKLVGDGLSTKDLIRSLENRVETIDASDIAEHINKKTSMLKTILSLRHRAVEELRLRTYRAKQRVLAKNSILSDSVKGEHAVEPTLMEFWNVELSTQKLEIDRLTRKCKTTVTQTHPLVACLNSVFGTQREKTKGKKKRKTAANVRNKEWLIDTIHGIYSERRKYNSDRTTSGIMSVTVKDFPNFVFSYFLRKCKEANHTRTTVQEFLDCLYVYSGKGGDPDSWDESSKDRWIDIFSDFLDGTLPTFAADFFIFSVTLIDDCAVGVKYPLLENYRIPYWISSTAADAIFFRLFPRWDKGSTGIVKKQIKALQSRASANEVAIAINASGDQSGFPDYRLPFLAFCDILLSAFDRFTQTSLENMYAHFERINPSKSGYISFSEFMHVIGKFNRLVSLHTNLEALFLQESSTIRDLTPSTAQFTEACKIDFLGICNVLELTGALTAHLGYMLQAPIHTAGDHGAEMFSAMTVIKSRSNKIYANILKGMQARECHDGIALLMFANDCVNLESSSHVSSFRLEYSVQRFLDIMHEQLLLQQSVSGEVAVGYFQESCETHMGIIDQRRGVGEEYLQRMLDRHGETTADKVARSMRVLLVIKRQLLKKLHRIRERKKKETERTDNNPN
jgi:hypothetical protein